MSIATALGGASRGGSDNWMTPPGLVLACHDRFGPFVLDAAADEASSVCPAWFGPGSTLFGPGSTFGTDALDVSPEDWRACGTIWLNPPFSKVGAFLKHLADACGLGATGVALCPARVETKWFHQQVIARAHTIWIPDKRISFLHPETGQYKGSPASATLIVQYGPYCTERPALWRRVELHGASQDYAVKTWE